LLKKNVYNQQNQDKNKKKTSSWPGQQQQQKTAADGNTMTWRVATSGSLCRCIGLPVDGSLLFLLLLLLFAVSYRVQFETGFLALTQLVASSWLFLRLPALACLFFCQKLHKTHSLQFELCKCFFVSFASDFDSSSGFSGRSLYICYLTLFESNKLFKF